MSDWEAPDTRRLAQLLVGNYFGERPEEKLDQIRAAKAERAAYLCKKIGFGPESVVLEIGSGMGFTSKHVAARVKRLYCADISRSFLDAARQECAGTENIEFIEIERQPAVFAFDDETFDVIFSDIVFIHLNLYDIYWYFSEFGRLAKKRGKVLINVMNAAKVDLEELGRMAGFYRKNRDSLRRLICWNSIDAVAAVAEHFGFSLESKWALRRLRTRHMVDLLFSKR